MALSFKRIKIGPTIGNDLDFMTEKLNELNIWSGRHEFHYRYIHKRIDLVKRILLRRRIVSEKDNNN